MARTKKIAVRLSVDPAKKVPRAESSVKVAPPVARPHCFRTGTRARMETHKFWFRQPEKLLSRRLLFSRLVREIAQDYMEAMLFKPEAINELHDAAEFYLDRTFEDNKLIARHAKRDTVYATDVSLVRRIPGEIE